MICELNNSALYLSVNVQRLGSLVNHVHCWVLMIRDASGYVHVHSIHWQLRHLKETGRFCVCWYDNGIPGIHAYLFALEHNQWVSQWSADIGNINIVRNTARSFLSRREKLILTDIRKIATFPLEITLKEETNTTRKKLSYFGRLACVCEVRQSAQQHWVQFRESTSWCHQVTCSVTPCEDAGFTESPRKQLHKLRLTDSRK